MQINLLKTTHNLTKQNLVGLNDTYKCSYCGIKGIRQGVSNIVIFKKKVSNICPNAPPSDYPSRVVITNRFNAYGKNFENVSEGKEFDVIEPPEDYKNKFPNTDFSVWIQGKFEPVRLLQGEFIEIKTEGESIQMNEKAKSAKGAKSKKETKQVQVPEQSAKANQPETNADAVYRVSKDKGELTRVSREDAANEMVESKTYSMATIEKAYEKGSVLATDAATYSTKRKKLEKLVKSDLTGETDTKDSWSETDMSDAAKASSEHLTASEDKTPSESAETPKSDNSESTDAPKETAEKVEIKEGDFVAHSDGVRWGDVKEKDGKLKVFFVHPTSGKLTSVNVSKDWTLLTAEEVQAKRDAQALATQDGVIQGEVVQPLTDDEKAELELHEGNVINAKQSMINAERFIAVEISVIREKELWRESVNANGDTFKSFIEYAIDRFGFERSYAFNLAQIGDYMRTVKGALPENASLNTATTLIRDSNQLKKALGLDDAGFTELKPVLVNTLQLLVESAPKDKNGEAVITPRIVSKFNETLESVVKTKTIEVDGKQMKLEKAIEKNVADVGFRSQFIEAVAESIKTNEQYIVDKAKEAYNRKVEPVTNGGEKKKSSGGAATEHYTGKVPTLQATCSAHGVQAITEIGHGVFTQACKCRWEISDTSKRLECFEFGGLRVKGR